MRWPNCSARAWTSGYPYSRERGRHGVFWGLTQGCDWRQPVLPAGFEAAFLNAFTMLAYFWWAAFAVGGVIGALAGLGSWLVRPRRKVSVA